MPGLALSVYEVVRELTLRLSTLVSLSVTRCKLDLASVSSYNRLTGDLSAQLSGDFRVGSTPDDDLNYLPYFYLMHPLHVSKFTQLFQRYLSGPLQELKEAISSLSESFTNLNYIFNIIKADATKLAASVKSIQKEHLPQDSKEKVKEETKTNERKIDTSVNSVYNKVTGVICALETHIKTELQKFKETLTGKKAELKGKVQGLKSFTKRPEAKNGLNSPGSTNGGKPDYYKIRDELYYARYNFGGLIGFLNTHWDRIKKDTRTDTNDIDQKIKESLAKIMGEDKTKEQNQSLNVYSEISKMERQLRLIGSSIYKLTESTELDNIFSGEKFTNPNVESFQSKVIDPFDKYIKELSDTLSKISEYKKKLDESYKQIQEILKPFEEVFKDDKEKKKSQIMKRHFGDRNRGTRFLNSLITFKGEIDQSIKKLGEGIKGLEELVGTGDSRGSKASSDESDQTSGESKGGTVREAIDKIRRELPTLKDINEYIKTLTEVKPKLQQLKQQDIIDKITTGKDEFSKQLSSVTTTIQGLKYNSYGGVTKVIKDIPQPPQPTETCAHSQESGSAVTGSVSGPPGGSSQASPGPSGTPTRQSSKNVGEELEAVLKELGKLGLYVKKAKTLGEIGNKLGHHKIETPEKDVRSQEINTCISELQRLEDQIKDKESTGPGTTGVGDGTTTANGKALSETLQANERKKKALRGDKKTIEGYKGELLEFKGDLVNIQLSTSGKSKEIKRLVSPMNYIDDEVKKAKKVDSSIHDLKKIKGNISDLNKNSKTISSSLEEIKQIKPLDQLEISKSYGDINELLRFINGILSVIVSYLKDNVKKRITEENVVITIDQVKEPIIKEISSIYGTTDNLDENDKSIKAQSVKYLEKFDTFKQSISRVEEAIESVVRDFIRCSLESLVVSLGNQLLVWNDYSKVRQMFGVLRDVTSKLQESISCLLQSHSQLYLSVSLTYSNTHQLINSIYQIERLVMSSIHNSKTHIKEQLETNKSKISNTIPVIETNIESIDTSLRQYINVQLTSITSQFIHNAKRPFTDFYDKMSKHIEFIKGVQGSNSTTVSEGSTGSAENSGKTKNTEKTVDVDKGDIHKIYTLIYLLNFSYNNGSGSDNSQQTLKTIDESKLSEANVNKLNKELPKLKSLIEGLQESRIEETVSSSKVTLDYDKLGNGERALQGFTEYVNQFKKKKEEIVKKKKEITKAFNEIKQELLKLDEVKKELDKLGKTSTIKSSHSDSAKKIEHLVTANKNIQTLVSQLETEVKKLGVIDTITKELDTIKQQLKGQETTPSAPNKLEHLKFMGTLRGLKEMKELNEKLKGYKGGTPAGQQTQPNSQPSSGTSRPRNSGNRTQPNTCKPNLKEIKVETEKLEYVSNRSPTTIQNIQYFKDSGSQGGSCPGGHSQANKYSQDVKAITDTVDKLLAKLEITGSDNPNTTSSKSTHQLTRAKKALEGAKAQLTNLTRYGQNIGNLDYITQTITKLKQIDKEINSLKTKEQPTTVQGTPPGTNLGTNSRTPQPNPEKDSVLDKLRRDRQKLEVAVQTLNCVGSNIEELMSLDTRELTQIQYNTKTLNSNYLSILANSSKLQPLENKDYLDSLKTRFVEDTSALQITTNKLPGIERNLDKISSKLTKYLEEYRNNISNENNNNNENNSNSASNPDSDTDTYPDNKHKRATALIECVKRRVDRMRNVTLCQMRHNISVIRESGNQICPNYTKYSERFQRFRHALTKFKQTIEEKLPSMLGCSFPYSPTNLNDILWELGSSNVSNTTSTARRTLLTSSLNTRTTLLTSSLTRSLTRLGNRLRCYSWPVGTSLTHSSLHTQKYSQKRCKLFHITHIL